MHGGLCGSFSKHYLVGSRSAMLPEQKIRNRGEGSQITATRSKNAGFRREVFYRVQYCTVRLYAAYFCRQYCTYVLRTVLTTLLRQRGLDVVRKKNPACAAIRLCQEKPRNNKAKLKAARRISTHCTSCSSRSLSTARWKERRSGEAIFQAATSARRHSFLQWCLLPCCCCL